MGGSELWVNWFQETQIQWCLPRPRDPGQRHSLRAQVRWYVAGGGEGAGGHEIQKQSSPRAEQSPGTGPEVTPLHRQTEAHASKAGIHPRPVLVGLGLVLRQRNWKHRESPEGVEPPSWFSGGRQRQERMMREEASPFLGGQVRPTSPSQPWVFSPQSRDSAAAEWRPRRILPRCQAAPDCPIHPPS